MSTFAEFIESKPAMDEQLSKVEHYAVMLCDALYLDIKRQQLAWHTQALESCNDNDKEYHQRKIAEINNTGVDHEYFLESGRKYHKLVHRTSGSNSVHCFIDKKTGEVYKSASWKAPAKGVRFDLRIIEQREWLLQNADWAGGYLYNR